MQSSEPARTIQLSEERERASQFVLFFAWLPLMCYGIVSSFATLSYFRHGHWPVYGQPDPKELRLPLYYAAAVISYPAALIASVVGFLSLTVAHEAWRIREIAGFATGILLWLCTPAIVGSLLNWLLD